MCQVKLSWNTFDMHVDQKCNITGYKALDRAQSQRSMHMDGDYGVIFVHTHFSLIQPFI